MPDKKTRSVSNLANRIADVPDAPIVTATDVGTSRAYNNGAATIAITSATGGLPSSYSITTTPTTTTTTATSSPVTISGLSSATSYTATVTPSNVSATGAATTSASFTATTVPQAPTIGAVTDLATGGAVTVAFTAGATGGSAITGYTATSSPGSITGTGSSSPITVSGLTDNTAYTFTVTGTNANGTSSASSASSSVTPTGPAFESIATVTVGSGGSANVEFTSIPATYSHLQIRGIGQSTRTGTNRSDLLVEFNNNSSGYAFHYLQGNGTAAAAYGVGSQSYGTVVSNTIPAQDYTSQFGAVVIDILDYANTNKNTTLRGLGGTDNNGAGVASLGSTLWNNTAAITSIKLTIDGAYNFRQYSQFALYGIKGA